LIWLKTQINVFPKPESRFLLPFPSKSKVKDSAVLLIVMKTECGSITTAASLFKVK